MITRLSYKSWVAFRGGTIDGGTIDGGTIDGGTIDGGRFGARVSTDTAAKCYLETMPGLNEILLENNRKWVAETLARDPEFFKNLADGQSPAFLWIGCSDSRVPANQVTGTRSGEVFVHRNIANMVIHTDMSMLSVLDYAVNVLKVQHVIVCGHYDCGGVKAAMGHEQFGLIDNWLRHIKAIYRLHQKELDAIEDEDQRCRRFVEINVIEQVYDLAKTSILRHAWRDGGGPAVHGWVYDVRDGLLQPLPVPDWKARRGASTPEVDPPPMPSFAPAQQQSVK